MGRNLCLLSTTCCAMPQDMLVSGFRYFDTCCPFPTFFWLLMRSSTTCVPIKARDRFVKRSPTSGCGCHPTSLNASTNCRTGVVANNDLDWIKRPWLLLSSYDSNSSQIEWCLRNSSTVCCAMSPPLQEKRQACRVALQHRQAPLASASEEAEAEAAEGVRKVVVDNQLHVVLWVLQVPGRGGQREATIAQGFVRVEPPDDLLAMLHVSPANLRAEPLLGTLRRS